MFVLIMLVLTLVYFLLARREQARQAAAFNKCLQICNGEITTEQDVECLVDDMVFDPVDFCAFYKNHGVAKYFNKEKGVTMTFFSGEGEFNMASYSIAEDGSLIFGPPQLGPNGSYIYPYYFKIIPFRQPVDIIAKEATDSIKPSMVIVDDQIVMRSFGEVDCGPGSLMVNNQGSVTMEVIGFNYNYQFHYPGCFPLDINEVVSAFETLIINMEITK